MKLIIRETWFSRETELRIDRFGIYILAYEYDWYQDYGVFYPVMDKNLKAGISYQYPLWLTNWLHGADMSHTHVSTNHFSFYVYKD